MRIGNKVIEYKNRLKLRSIHKHKILVGGCFDVFHFGHLKFLQNSKKFGDILIIALESDEFIKKNKKREPVHTQIQRAAILSSINIVDYVLLLPQMNRYGDYSKMVKDIKPQIVAITKGDTQTLNKKKQIESLNGKLKIATSFIPDFSTKDIIKRFT